MQLKQSLKPNLNRIWNPVEKVKTGVLAELTSQCTT